ncbi:MAG: aspartyl-tRNA(Asn)/glutamyl-tRNA (Gln) amidotransferase subunit A [Parcubacteria group bacterium Gr01-1014_72]|nr:MAG: aspartyl-tRNA(Asn)/glutamyl-tRNA (Gln) amidotransferase subunit A [Parcubacteria group bacterium Gr01-1014_72]
MIDLNTLTITKAHAHLLSGDFSAVELAEAYLAEIEKKNLSLNAYLEVFDDVLVQAAEADKKLKNLKTAELPNLLGIPLAIKDNILIKGRRVGAASKILEGYIASYDATAIAKLKEAGAVFLGRTNMDEFAMGGSTENSAFGPTKNPHDPSRVPGGSSGGSAAAVAADMALAALGSDTGGSVRQPASFCGVVGMKPTYGAVSRSGLIAMGSSLDQIGPITKTVEDAKILFEAITGRDPKDSTSEDNTIYRTISSRGRSKGKTVIGVPRSFTHAKGIDADVLKNFDAALARLARAGYVIRDIKLPSVAESLPTYYILMPAEASTNLARFDGVKYGLHRSGEDLLGDYFATRGNGFGREVRRRILLGTYVLSAGYYDAYYGRAVAMRDRIRSDFDATFETVDVIATPTTPTPAFKIGEKTGDPLEMYLADIFTVTANIAGVPALSVPSGSVSVGDEKLPLGIQFMGRRGEESVLFSVGERFAA